MRLAEQLSLSRVILQAALHVTLGLLVQMLKVVLLYIMVQICQKSLLTGEMRSLGLQEQMHTAATSSIKWNNDC